MRWTGLLLLFVSSALFANEVEVNASLARQEKRIAVILNALRSTSNNQERQAVNAELQTALQEVLVHPGVMDYPFASWTTMSTIAAPDGAFRMFNWNVEDDQQRHTHFCYLVRPTRPNKPNRVYSFEEDKSMLSRCAEDVLTPSKWYGALYYKIIPVRRGNKTYYTVLGYNGKDRSSNVKVIDAFYFRGHSLRMGHPLFQGESEGQLAKRVFFEYAEKATVSLNVNEKIGGIVFDHLVPEQKNVEGIYSLYVPDMTYDAYKWKEGLWQYEADVVAYNDPFKKVKKWHPVDDSDSSAYTEVDNKWINPVDSYAPLPTGSNPIAPVEDARDNKHQKRVRRQSVRKRRRFKHLKRKKSRYRSAIHFK